MLIESTWKRIGLSQSPDKNSGQGVGIIILDEILSHSTIQHLTGRVKRVEVDGDLQITCSDVLQEPPVKKVRRYMEHGLMVLNLLAHQPLEVGNEIYTGLAPAAHFIFLYEEDPQRRKAGLEWILQQDWNIKICLNLQVPQERGWISPTKQDPNVQSLQPVLDAGVLVVAAGGNSRAHNNLHPKSYFVIGGYNDKGTSNERNYALHPSVASGLNGDGHWRPDLIAPYTYLPLPGLSGKGIDYFAGTCGTSTMVTGLIAQIWSQMPDITPNEIRNTLIDTGDVLDGFPAPIVNGAKAIRFLESGQQRNNPILTDPVVQITDENHSITSDNPLERALALTLLIKKGKLTREQIWEYATNESPMAKKVAIQGLGSPTDDIERERIWERVHMESSDFGVRETWAYMLLETTTKEELSKWIDLVQYPSIDIQICINLFVQRYYPDAPGIEPLPDPDLEVMKATAAPLLAWYKNYQVCS